MAFYGGFVTWLFQSVSLPSQCLFPLWGFGLTAQHKRLSACETPVCYCIYQPISCKCHVSTKLDNSHMQSNTTALQYIVHFKGCCTKQWIIDRSLLKFPPKRPKRPRESWPVYLHHNEFLSSVAFMPSARNTKCRDTTGGSGGRNRYARSRVQK